MSILVELRNGMVGCDYYKDMNDAVEQSVRVINITPQGRGFHVIFRYHGEAQGSSFTGLNRPGFRRHFFAS